MLHKPPAGGNILTWQFMESDLETNDSALNVNTLSKTFRNFFVSNH